LKLLKTGDSVAAWAALEQVRSELVTLWDRLGPLWGVSPSAARVHGWLMTQPEPQDAEEIAAGLAMSRGAVSMACTELVEWGVITAERSAGSRRSVFRPVTDLEQVIRSIVQTRKQREWDPAPDAAGPVARGAGRRAGRCR
jgi:DNA-binding transcriptional regulator GbsR (MarR family)